MVGDPFSITELKPHLSGLLDGTERFSALTDRRATTGGHPNLQVPISQILAYVIANGGGGGSLADGDKGDITVSGSGATWTIDPTTITTGKLADNAVTLAKLATQNNNTILGNISGGSAVPSALTAAQTKTLLAIASTDVSGLATIATSGSATDLSGGTVAAARMPALTGDVTTSAGAVATTVAAAAITLAKMANLAANSIIGNNTGSGATPLALSGSQVTALLSNVVGDSGSGGAKGLVPAPASGDAAAAKFLKADGTWATTGGGGLSSQADKTLFGNISGGSAVPGSLTAEQGNSIIGVYRTSAPGSPTSGQLAVADGSTWDPNGRHDAQPYHVMYDGSQWLPVSGGSHPGYVAGNWYMLGGGRVTTGAAVSINTIYLVPFMVWRRMTISDLGLRIATASASGNIRLQLYASNATTKMPTGTGVGGSGIISTATTGGFSVTLGSTAVLNPGLYWMSGHMDANAGSATFMANDGSAAAFGSTPWLVGASSFANLWAANSGLVQGFSASATYASGVPDLTSASFTAEGANLKAPLLAAKVTTVP